MEQTFDSGQQPRRTLGGVQSSKGMYGHDGGGHCISSIGNPPGFPMSSSSPQNMANLNFNYHQPYPIPMRHNESLPSTPSPMSVGENVSHGHITQTPPGFPLYDVPQNHHHHGYHSNPMHLSQSVRSSPQFNNRVDSFSQSQQHLMQGLGGFNGMDNCSLDMGMRNQAFHYGNPNRTEEYRGSGGGDHNNFVHDRYPGSTSSSLYSPPEYSSAREYNLQSYDKVQEEGVIKPLIDNIVGSMMCNGTYTHFGPLGGSDALSHAHLSEDQLYCHINREGKIQNVMEESSVNIPISVPMKIEKEMPEGSGKVSPTLRSSPVAQSFQQSGRRSSTPSEANDSSSRPHTPNKPSYSEILSKTGGGNAVAAPNVHRKPTVQPTASTTSNKSPIREVLANSHRKSDSSSTGFVSSSSTSSSNCPSSSSSPVVKQKTLSQTIMGKLFTSAPSTGKENSFTEPKPKSTSRSSNTSTNFGKRKSDVKATSETTGNMKEKAKSKGDKPNQEGLVEDFIYSNAKEVEAGWKTYSRNKNARNNTQFSTSSKTQVNELKPQPQSLSSFSGTMASEDCNGSAAEGGISEIGPESRRDSLTEKKNGTTFGGTSGGLLSGGYSQRKGKEREKPKNRKEGRNCTVRRLERILYLWTATMISALAWLYKLVTDVVTLSLSVGCTLVQDISSWWVNKALPNLLQQYHTVEDATRRSYRKLKKKAASWKSFLRRKDSSDRNTTTKKGADDLLAALGPSKNMQILNADDTLKRLLSCKGQDPYSILGVRSDSSDETVRRYYKKQAVLVHPDKNLLIGAEEAFKILGKAFEIIGDPMKREEYHSKLLEAHAKEQVYGEIGKLLEQLRKKMEIATSSIRCTKCNQRHKKNKTDRPLFAARFCAQCNIHHAAREGELWAESRSWLGLSWNYYTCMDSHIWEINEWAKCQKKNLHHIKADSHGVMYRLVAGGGNNGQQSNCSEGQFQSDPEEEWNSLINNLCKASGSGVPGNKPDHFYQQGTGNNSNYYNGNASTSNCNGASAGGKQRKKGKRK